MENFQLTEFQKSKILAVFDNLYDSNKDGVIQESDFDEAIQKICSIHSWPIGGEKYLEAKKTLASVWQGLKGYADINKDGLVTRDEWLQMWAICVRDVLAGKGFPQWQKNYMKFMFEMNDTSGDEFIDRSEYITVNTSFGICGEDCNAAFDQLSAGTNGMISKGDFEKLWEEYFTSDNTSDRGNYLFGLPPI